MPVEARLRAALAEQFARRRAVLGAGASHVGWKLGVGDAERIGGPVIGYLTSATLLDPGDRYRGETNGLHADAEVAVMIGGGYAAALELVDLGAADTDAATIVATNVFHRAVAFGPFASESPPFEVRVTVNGELRAEGTSAASFEDRIDRVRELLEPMGEKLRPGDRIITGSVVQVAVAGGDEVAADFGELGRVQLFVA